MLTKDEINVPIALSAFREKKNIVVSGVKLIISACFLALVKTAGTFYPSSSAFIRKPIMDDTCACDHLFNSPADWAATFT